MWTLGHSLAALIMSSTVLRVPLGSRQPGDIGRNAPCFVFGQKIGRRPMGSAFSHPTTAKVWLGRSGFE
jgi:hypothetical protein